jgi:hypothetical protein
MYSGLELSSISSTATPSLYVTPPTTIVPSSHSTLSHTNHWSVWKLYNLKEFHRRPWITLSQIHSCLINTSADSLWPTPIHHLTSIQIHLVTNFNLVLANTASAPLHTCQTNCMTAYALVCCCIPCLPHASLLLSRRASTILAKIHRVANSNHLRPHTADNHQSYRPLPSSTHPSEPCALVQANVPLAFPAD